jgi:hypothetical protein
MEPTIDIIEIVNDNQPTIEVFNTSIDCIDGISWENLDYGPTGIPVGYLGKPWEKFCSVNIRSTVTKLKIKGHKNVINMSCVMSLV